MSIGRGSCDCGPQKAHLRAAVKSPMAQLGFPGDWMAERRRVRPGWGLRWAYRAGLPEVLRDSGYRQARGPGERAGVPDSARPAAAASGWACLTWPGFLWSQGSGSERKTNGLCSEPRLTRAFTY